MTTDAVTVVGTGTQYPPYRQGVEFLSTLAFEHYENSPALRLQKTLDINQKSRIECRYSILPESHPLWHQDSLPTITECDSSFKQYGIPMAEEAARKAIRDWNGSARDITHLVAVTCSNTSNPGFDLALCKNIGLGKNTERILLHGIGCAGGITALRAGYQLLLGALYQGKPARALIVSCETLSVFIRRGLENVVKDQVPNVAPVLFGDCASAMLLSNGIGATAYEKRPIWNILGAQTALLEGSGYIEYNVGPSGYLATITKDVPRRVESALPAGFRDLIASTPSLCSEELNFDPTTYDWALHPGGYSIITAAEKALKLTAYHLRKTYEAYKSAGNTSSATVLSIMDKLAREPSSGIHGREKLIGVAFGPDITMEMIVLARTS